MKYFILFFLAAPALAADAIPPVPTEFCESPTKLLWGAQTCAENRRLAEGAERCLAHLEALERKLGVEAEAIAQGGVKSQLGETHTGSHEYGFSDRAFTHLIAVARLADQEIEPFPDYLLAPEDYYNPKHANPDAYALALPCHGGMAERVAKVRAAFAAKIARFEARRSEALRFQKTLQGAAVAYDSSSRGAASSRGQGGSAPGLRRPAEASTSRITGIDEERARRAAAKIQ